MIYVSINSKLQYSPQASLRVSELLKIGSFKFPPPRGSNAPPKRRIWYLFFFLKEKICKLDFQVIDQTLPPGHGRWISTRGLPGGRDVENSNWSVHYVVMDCLDLSAKQQIEQLTFSWVLYFTPFVSWFPVLLSSNSFHFRLSILQIH